MKIYYAPNSRAVRIVWLFEELGLPYELVSFKLGERKMREPDYLGIHPMGRVPALEDGDTTIFESGAIVEYVLAKYGGGKLLPTVSDPEFPAYLQWLHYAEGMIMPQVNVIVVENLVLARGRAKSCKRQSGDAPTEQDARRGRAKTRRPGFYRG